jgi:hypothetical protein
MKIIKSWVGEVVIILAAIVVMALIALSAVEKISKRIDQQMKARAAYSEIQQ